MGSRYTYFKLFVPMRNISFHAWLQSRYGDEDVAFSIQ
jgi:hypothetical protein